MKSIPVESLDHHVVDTIKSQQSEEPVVLTENSRAVGLVWRIPEEFNAIDFTMLFHREIRATGPGCKITIRFPKANGAIESEPAAGQGVPVFGSCRGMLSIIADDDEHLKDFEEYMK